MLFLRTPARELGFFSLGNIMTQNLFYPDLCRISFAELLKHNPEGRNSCSSVRRRPLTFTLNQSSCGVALQAGFCSDAPDPAMVTDSHVRLRDAFGFHGRFIHRRGGGLNASVVHGQIHRLR
jgi:hypothetical protein